MDFKQFLAQPVPELFEVAALVGQDQLVSGSPLEAAVPIASYAT